MTEEIIIDGISVAGCEHINALGKKIKCVILQDDVCEITPYCEGYDCYYKQLKRLEQENKDLKIYIESNKQQVEEVETLVMDNDRLLNENKKLKERQINWYNHEATKYKQALEEIRKLVKGYKNSEGMIRQTTTEYLIQNKINEVLR